MTAMAASMSRTFEYGMPKEIKVALTLLSSSAVDASSFFFIWEHLSLEEVGNHRDFV